MDSRTKKAAKAFWRTRYQNSHYLARTYLRMAVSGTPGAMVGARNCYGRARQAVASLRSGAPALA